VRPVHFFADGRSEAMQIDIASDSGNHLQLALDPFTARARVTQLYRSQEHAAVSQDDPNAGKVTVVRGGSQ
jgi:hypothetical protein